MAESPEQLKKNLQEILAKLKEAGITLYEIHTAFSEKSPKAAGAVMLKKLKQAGITLKEVGIALDIGPVRLMMMDVASAMAVMGVAMALQGNAMLNAGRTKLETVQDIKRVADTEDAPKTSTALEKEGTEATSEITQGKTKRDWGALLGASGAGGDTVMVGTTAISLLKRRKKKPGEVDANTAVDKDKPR